MPPGEITPDNNRALSLSLSLSLDSYITFARIDFAPRLIEYSEVRGGDGNDRRSQKGEE